MKISAFIVDSFKRIDHFEYAPDADRVLVRIKGRNGQGKSSIIDALTAAFGGKEALPNDPVRHGASEAEILVELDDGQVTIRRTIKPDGSSTLEVRDPNGKLKGPQGVLDKLVGSRFLDPLQFLSLPGPKQRKALLDLIDRAGVIAKLDARRAITFVKRTDAGRDQKKAAAEFERIPEVTPDTPVDVDALTVESRAFAEAQRKGEQARSAYEVAKSVAANVQASLAAAIKRKDELEAEVIEQYAAIEILEGQAAAFDGNAVEAKRTLEASVAKWREDAARRAAVDDQLRGANEHNRGVFAAEAQAKRRLEVAAEVEKHTAEVDALTGELEGIDASKAEFLAAAALPVPGLGVAPENVTLRGVPLDQASGAERIRVALALAIAGSPNLRDVWVRDGALLDDQAMEDLEREAEAAGVTVWIERVNDSDPNAITIHDGRIKEVSEAA